MEAAARKPAPSGATPDSPGTGRTFVLVTGGTTPRPRIVTFTDEQHARSAFMVARTCPAPRVHWAELVAFDQQARRKTLAWFGTDPGVELPAPLAKKVASRSNVPPAPWWKQAVRRLGKHARSTPVAP